MELRPFAGNGPSLSDALFRNISGIGTYDPSFSEFDSEGRNSYSLGISFSQILSKSLQAALSLDLVRQEGLLSTPFQRVYFSDREDFYIENFQLADAVEQLPDTRNKWALGGRFNYFVNPVLVLRTYYRFYADDWGIRSNTAEAELPIKISPKFTLYPSYRFYQQSATDYFAGYEQHHSTDHYYTSDYDLSKFNASQYGFGIQYSQIFSKFHIWHFRFKNARLDYNYYQRNTGLTAHLISGGIKFTEE